MCSLALFGDDVREFMEQLRKILYHHFEIEQRLGERLKS